MPSKDGMIVPSAPRFALAWAIGEVRRSPIGLTVTGVLWLVGPAWLGPRSRFRESIQKRKAAPQHRANRIDSHVGDIAQAEVTDIATQAVLSPSIGNLLVCW
jgi:hypothetical protein